MDHSEIAETPPPASDNRLLRGLDSLNEWLSRPVFWLTLLMVFATCTVVIMRRFLGVGSIALQEAVVYLHATVFLLGAASAFKAGAMVRVDIFYRRFSDTTRAWIDALGTLLFLLPFCIFVFWISWDFVARAWLIGEQSSDAGGLAYVYLLKTLILLFAVTLMLQALAELVRASLVLITPKTTGEQSHAD